VELPESLPGRTIIFGGRPVVIPLLREYIGTSVCLGRRVCSGRCVPVVLGRACYRGAWAGVYAWAGELLGQASCLVGELLEQACSVCAWEGVSGLSKWECLAMNCLAAVDARAGELLRYRELDQALPASTLFKCSMTHFQRKCQNRSMPSLTSV